MNTDTFDVVIGVSYYAPYVSGLTEAARIEAEELAARGYRVCVVTNQHDPSLPRTAVIRGVSVVRCPVWLRLDRGIASPSFVPTCVRLARRAASAHLHVPMLEAGVIARRLRGHTRVVVTHHIDLWLPRTLTSPAAVAAANWSTRLAVRAADLVVVNSLDQARGSRFWPLLRQAELQAIPAPCHLRDQGQPVYRDGNGPHYGFLGRIVPDKGLDYLLAAFSQVEDPDARLLLGGESDSVAGGGVLARLREQIDADPRIRVLGMLRGTALNNFYASIDVFTLPSRAESFGIVQAEAIMLGIPAITSDLAGGRFPVTHTGLGMLVPPQSVPDLTTALISAPTAFSRIDRDAGAARARAGFGIERFVDDIIRALRLRDTTDSTSCGHLEEDVA
jgi:glycosyltransferase involved in cell wall biosynthesis